MTGVTTSRRGLGWPAPAHQVATCDDRRHDESRHQRQTW